MKIKFLKNTINFFCNSLLRQGNLFIIPWFFVARAVVFNALLWMHHAENAALFSDIHFFIFAD